MVETDENTTNPQQVPPTLQASHTLLTIKLPILKKGVSTIDANPKFLRSLPSSWSQVSLIMRTKPEVDTLNFDDLYNNLRVFQSNVKGSIGSSSSTQNVAFVSSDNTSSTNEVNTAFSVSTSSRHNSQKEGSSSYTDNLMYSFFANQSSGPQLDHEDLKQVDEFDLEVMDLKWQVAMIFIRLEKFYKKTSRKLYFDGKNKKEHEEHLRMILKVLKKEELYAMFSKCEFWIPKVQFLGQVINSEDIHVDPAKIKSIKDWVSPRISNEEANITFCTKFIDIFTIILRITESPKNIKELHGPSNIWEKLRPSPFEALYGKKYRSPVCWNEVREFHLTGPDIVQETTEKIIQIKQRMQAARDRKKSYIDLKRKPMEFQVWDKVLLKVSPWKGVVRFGKRGKLKPRYVGPFNVLERVGDVAYKFDLPEELSRSRRGFPTVSGLEAGQDKENIIKTSALPRDSTPRVTFLDADEGNMQQKLQELTDLCTHLQRQQTKMALKINARDVEISNLKARIKLLEDKNKGTAELSGDDAPIKGRSLETVEEVGVERSTERGSNDTEELVNVLTSLDAANILTSGVQAVSIPSAAEVSNVGVPTGSGLVPTVSAIFTNASVVIPYSRRKVVWFLLLVLYLPLLVWLYHTQDVKMLIDGLDRNNEVIAKHLQEGMTLEEIREKFIPVWKQIEDLVPMASKEEGERVKRKGLKLEQGSAKRIKISEDVSKEDLKEMMHLVPVEEEARLFLSRVSCFVIYVQDCLNFEDSRALGFVHRPPELLSLAYGNPIF
nr:putative reverse transcriptase domain-containing protein [Tanacetum cinerariifolium]